MEGSFTLEKGATGTIDNRTVDPVSGTVPGKVVQTLYTKGKKRKRQ